MKGGRRLERGAWEESRGRLNLSGAAGSTSVGKVLEQAHVLTNCVRSRHLNSFFWDNLQVFDVFATDS